MTLVHQGGGGWGCLYISFPPPSFLRNRIFCFHISLVSLNEKIRLKPIRSSFELPSHLPLPPQWHLHSPPVLDRSHSHSPTLTSTTTGVLYATSKTLFLSHYSYPSCSTVPSPSWKLLLPHFGGMFLFRFFFNPWNDPVSFTTSSSFFFPIPLLSKWADSVLAYIPFPV